MRAAWPFLWCNLAQANLALQICVHLPLRLLHSPPLLTTFPRPMLQIFRWPALCCLLCNLDWRFSRTFRLVQIIFEHIFYIIYIISISISLYKHLAEMFCIRLRAKILLRVFICAVSLDLKGSNPGSKLQTNSVGAQSVVHGSFVGDQVSKMPNKFEVKSCAVAPMVWKYPLVMHMNFCIPILQQSIMQVQQDI